jgi:hypothetical protein
MIELQFIWSVFLFEFRVSRLPIASIDSLSPQVRTDQSVLPADIQNKQDH